MSTDHLKPHQFKKGQSGNPKGKDPGHKSKRIWYETMMGPHRNELFQKAIHLALHGDTDMIKMFMRSELPPKVRDQLDEKLAKAQIEYTLALIEDIKYSKQQLKEIKDVLIAKGLLHE